MKSLCFTGHRDFIDEKDTETEAKLRGLLKKNLMDYIVNQEVDTFYAGGASGFDNYAASCVLELKNEYPEIRLIEVLPFDRNNMSSKWEARDRALLMYVCGLADEIIEEKGSEHYNGCYKDRNQYMVDHADFCVAWYNEKKKARSGTGQTVRMSQRKGIPVYNLFEKFNQAD